jgi:diacylglycerol kinase family enzyme
MGSGNDTARALGLAGFGWRLALDRALKAETTCIDIGEARFEETANAMSRHIVFISSLTAGFDSAVNLRAKAAPGWLSGMPRYLWATLGELLALRHWPLKVIADGELLHDGPGLFASTLNTRSFGGGMPAIPHARIDDGQLNLLLAGDIQLGQVLNLLPRLLVGWHLHRPQIQHRAFSRMRIESTLPIPLAADGEYLGQTHAVNVQVRAGSLMVIRGKK